jgi:hypothetical protein
MQPTHSGNSLQLIDELEPSSTADELEPPPPVMSLIVFPSLEQPEKVNTKAVKTAAAIQRFVVFINPPTV